MKKLLLLPLFALSLFAQNVIVQPECSFNFQYTVAAGVITSGGGNTRTGGPFGAGYSVIGQGCTSYDITYSAQGLTGLSLRLESAPDAAGIPGAWAAFVGTINIGGNPNTSLTGGFTNVSATPSNLAAWISVNLTGLVGTGTINGRVYGYRTLGTFTTGPGAPTQNVNVAQVAGTNTVTAKAGVIATGGTDATGAAPTANPNLVAVQDSSGNVVIPTQCTKTAIFDTSAAGNLLLVAASGTTQVRVCKLSFEDVPGTNTVQLKQGTGATCAGGTTNLWMAYVTVQAVAEDFVLNPLVGVAANAVCINLANATRVTGAITWAQY